MRVKTFDWTADLAFSYMIQNPGIEMEYVNPFGGISRIKWSGEVWYRKDSGCCWELTSLTSFMTTSMFRIYEGKEAE